MALKIMSHVILSRVFCPSIPTLSISAKNISNISQKINFIQFNRNTNYIKYFHNYTHKYEKYSTIKPTQLPHKHIIRHYKNFIIESRKAKLCSDI